MSGLQMLEAPDLEVAQAQPGATAVPAAQEEVEEHVRGERGVGGLGAFELKKGRSRDTPRGPPRRPQACWQLLGGRRVRRLDLTRRPGGGANWCQRQAAAASAETRGGWAGGGHSSGLHASSPSHTCSTRHMHNVEAAALARPADLHCPSAHPAALTTHRRAPPPTPPPLCMPSLAREKTTTRGGTRATEQRSCARRTRACRRTLVSWQRS